MVARAKVVTAKWGVAKSEPEDLPDFLSNDEIVDKMGGDPRGVFRVWIKKITVVKNKNGDDMLKITAEIFDTDKEKKGYNGFALWENQNVTDEGARFLKQFLKSFGATWADFQQRTKMTPETKLDPATITSIGKANFAGSKKVLAKVTVGMDKGGGGYDPKPSVRRWLPLADDMDDADIEDEELDDEDLEDEELEEDLEEVDEDEELEDDEDSDDEEAQLREELDGLGVVALKKRAKSNDEDLEKVPTKKADLIDLIVEQEMLLDDEEEPEEEDEDLGEDEEDAEAELRAELEDLTIGALKLRAKGNGAKVAVLKPIKDKAKVIDIVVEQELSGDDGDDNEPPF